ncbi:hypothetical protein, partial [Bacteroides faecis]|uniref:hypothetical protein n=1 Tax=Bacteroides faecis TaxID=674529 RepID=UPI002100D433
LHSLFSGKDRDLKIQRQRVLYRGITNKLLNPIKKLFTCNTSNNVIEFDILNIITLSVGHHIGVH